jgi:hypothetical protein
MTPIAVAGIAFAVIAVAGLAGLRLSLGDRFVSDSSRDAVRLAQGIVASIAALVLGLLIASASDHYRSQGQELTRFASQVLVLDRMLREYGPEASGVRATMREALEHARAALFAHTPPQFETSPGQTLFDAIVRLEPANPRQVFLHARALEQVLALMRSVASMGASQRASAVQPPMIVVLVLWFSMLFFAVGLFAAPNAMVTAAVLLGSAAVASALLLVLELDRPFVGLMSVSDTVLRTAIGALEGR